MGTPQAYVTWRGLKAHGEVQAVLQHGIEPSKFQIQVAPDPELDLGGTFSICQGAVRIDFPDCRADYVDQHKQQDGLLLWTIVVLDRRWKWKECGQVSGYYNVRDGKDIRKGTEKNIRELMKLCLDALGEQGYDVSQVDEANFPPVEWEYALPAIELDKLAQSINYRIVYKPSTNRFAILPADEGQQLQQGDAVEFSQTFNPPEQPDSLVFIGNRTLWETDLELEAVALDTDLTWKLLNKVSYHPIVTPINITDDLDANYWYNFVPSCDNINDAISVTTTDGTKSLKEFARSQVYRRYRVKTPFMLNKFGKVTDLAQILPLIKERLSTIEIGGVSRKQNAIVWGTFTHGNCAMKNNSEFTTTGALRNQQSPAGNPPKGLLYGKGWRLDVETAIIEFDEPVFIFTKYPGGMEVDGKQVDRLIAEPPKLFLRTSFGVRDLDTRAWTHEEIKRQLPGRKFKTKPRYVKQNDVQLTYIDSGTTKTTDNKKDYEKAAKFYLDQEQRQYQVQTPCAVEWPGIRKIDPDGAVQQITWQITDKGASTRASRNREEKILGITLEEQRLRQQTADRLKEDNSARGIADKQRKSA